MPSIHRRLIVRLATGATKSGKRVKITVTRIAVDSGVATRGDREFLRMSVRGHGVRRSQGPRIVRIARTQQREAKSC